MRCDQFEEAIALRLSGEISQELGNEFAQHLAACSHCAALLKEQIRADQLLRASLSAQPVNPLAVKDRVWRKIDTPWWSDVLRMRTLQAAFASVLVLIAVFVMARHGQSTGAAMLLESAESDHIEDVVRRVQKSGWVTDQHEAENLAATVVGDRRPVLAFAPSGYTLARA
ncbi:MAG TPA: zf-HC2 domain-containing protein, partial [Bryobacteraceae bacterium]|nr:zf-HC2 domain-containing protein [Bryobacteraceae bacterium]